MSYEVQQNRFPKGWRVIHVTPTPFGTCGSHVATYTTKEVADEVADFLTRNMENEVEW